MSDIPTRRQALHILGATAIASVAGLPAPAAPKKDADDAALDEVLKRMQGDEPKAKRGLSTHAPMAVEALCALGLGAKAVDWYDRSVAPMRELPPAERKITAANWKDAVGANVAATTWEGVNHRWGDWKEFYTGELAEKKWEDVLDVWVARLAPGLSGAATHGVIRTAHAVRGLGRKVTPERTGELARGLAYWASSYEELPAVERKKPAADTFAKALDEVPLYRQAFGKAPDGGNIAEVLRSVKTVDGFAAVRDLVAAPADLPKAISALTATFARVYLRYGTKNDPIAFVHAVTGPCSLRRLAPHVSAKTAAAALPYAWQAAAAIFCMYVRKRDDGTPEESKLTAEELIERAGRNGDEHAIKFTEVMVAEHRLNPDPAYLAAAEDAIRRL